MVREGGWGEKAFSRTLQYGNLPFLVDLPPPFLVSSLWDFPSPLITRTHSFALATMSHVCVWGGAHDIFGNQHYDHSRFDNIPDYSRNRVRVHSSPLSTSRSHLFLDARVCFFSSIERIARALGNVTERLIVDDMFFYLRSNDVDQGTATDINSICGSGDTLPTDPKNTVAVGESGRKLVWSVSRY